MGINEILYNIYDLRHMSKLAADFQKKDKNIYLLKYQSKKSGKIFKNEAAEPYLEPCQISKMEGFCKNAMAKSFIIDLWYGCKYTSEVVQDSKINLKWMNTKMLEKTVHFFNVHLPEDISTQEYPKISEAEVRT